MELVNHSYKGDCIFLLKDLTNVVKEITVEEKEDLIRAGVNYSEMISKEAIPSDDIKNIFLDMLNNDKTIIAYYVAKLAESIYKEKGKDLVIVSLARAGTPYGILIKKYIEYKFNIEVPHYSISIIRGKGIDKNALRYILNKHKKAEIQFVDGWTGKGSITRELNESIKEFNLENNCNIDDSLAAISDPAKLCKVYGTREDFGLATCCLNATVSGLISRTIHNKNYIGIDDFHGAKKLTYLESQDLSQYFIDVIMEEFLNIIINEEDLINEEIDSDYSKNITDKVQKMFNVKSLNNVKLSVGESARVLLRRDARVVLVKDKNDKNIKHIIQLAKEKNVDVVEYSESDYRCIAIINEG